MCYYKYTKSRSGSTSREVCVMCLFARSFDIPQPVRRRKTKPIKAKKMKVYSIRRTQFLPVTPREAWDFFSSPANLPRITPESMGFKILYSSGDGVMYPGQLIRYRVNIMPMVSLHWVTEITHVHEPAYFVDEQRFGPYALWHHQHHFKEVAGGIEMTDEVNYAIPFGFIGQLANWLFVEQRVNVIFDYRFAKLKSLFNDDKANIRKSA